jgi:hypothetical protein
LEDGFVFGQTADGKLVVALPDFSGEQRNRVYTVAEPKEVHLLGETIAEFVEKEAAKIVG